MKSGSSLVNTIGDKPVQGACRVARDATPEAGEPLVDIWGFGSPGGALRPKPLLGWRPRTSGGTGIRTGFRFRRREA
jgi:hypothetical protein